MAPEAADAVEAVLDLVSGTRIADVEIEWNGTYVRVKREPSNPTGPASEPDQDAPEDQSVVVTSVYVGVFHREPASAFPSLGDEVTAGQTIAHVETLRIQNAVVAPADGLLAELLVDDGTPVEYGQPLLVVQPGHRDEESEAPG